MTQAPSTPPRRFWAYLQLFVHLGVVGWCGWQAYVHLFVGRDWPAPTPERIEATAGEMLALDSGTLLLRTAGGPRRFVCKPDQARQAAVFPKYRGKYDCLTSVAMLPGDYARISYYRVPAGQGRTADVILSLDVNGRSPVTLNRRYNGLRNSKAHEPTLRWMSGGVYLFVIFVLLVRVGYYFRHREWPPFNTR